MDEGTNEGAERETATRRERRRAVGIAAAGVVLTAAYAAVMVVQILVWNPLAAAPAGLTLSEIYTTMQAAGEYWPGSEAWEFAMAGLGIALSVALLIAAVRVRRPRPMLVATGVATLIALGAPAYWLTSFSMGMSLGDTFSSPGAGPEAVPLMIASGLAAVTAFVLALQPGTLASPASTLTPTPHLP